MTRLILVLLIAAGAGLWARSRRSSVTVEPWTEPYGDEGMFV